MERVLAELAELSPTRLEGMEITNSRKPSSATRPSPTRLEGMERIKITTDLATYQVSDPP